VAWNEYRTDLADRLQALLDHAEDERPVQEFLEAQPFVLPLALFGPLHPNAWCFPRPRLGGGTFIPDFMACDRDSLGFQWKLVELESPTARPTNKDSSISRDCHHAVEQIRDYRRWLRDHAEFERGQGWPHIHGDCEAWIVIGRRGERTESARERLADFKKEAISIMSYDRLVEQYRQTQVLVNGVLKAIKAQVQALDLPPRREQ
jgi:hypothetical protein